MRRCDICQSDYDEEQIRPILLKLAHDEEAHEVRRVCMGERKLNLCQNCFGMAIYVERALSIFKNVVVGDPTIDFVFKEEIE